jgi:putative flippase GtrA
MKLSPQALLNNTIVRWWIIGIVFMVINIVLLDWFIQGLGMGLTWATVTSSEICTLLRYVLNDYWVFGNPRPSWKRCWEYHLANLSSFFLWSFVIVVLGKKFGVDHRLAAVIATIISVGWSMVTNFLWVWRSKPTKSAATDTDTYATVSEEIPSLPPR